MRQHMVQQLAAIALLSVAAACGGGDGTSPTTPGTGGGAAATSGGTITIANGRVSPAEVTINTGQTVTFVNNDGRTRNVSSDPHPSHTDCPAINAVGNLANGQTRQTNAFTAARTCGFHDHDDPDNTIMRGRIIVR